MEAELSRYAAGDDEIRPGPEFVLPDLGSAIPKAFQALSPEQRDQIAAYVCKVLDALDDAEDMLWETEEEDIARRLGEALEKCSQALERVKAQLPHDELHRLEFARSCVNQVFHGGEADADQAAMEAERSLAAQILPEEQRAAFLSSMGEARDEVRAQFQASMQSDERRAELERSISDKLVLLEAALCEAQETLLSVDASDLHEVACFSVAFARFSAGSLRGTVESAAALAVPTELALRRDEAPHQARFEELQDDGAPAPAGSAHAERRARRRRRKRCGRVRLLWPSLRRTALEPLATTAARRVRADPTAQAAAAVAGVVLLPLWTGLLCLALLLFLPLLAIDEALQALYNRQLADLKVTIQAEETLFALLAAARVWFLLAKISIKQTFRLARRQLDKARQRPGGLAQLAQDAAQSAMTLAVDAGAEFAKDPWAPVRAAHGAASSLWGQAHEYRARHASALD